MSFYTKLSLLFCLLCSCGLFQPISTNVVHISPKFAALSEYKVGSYWIYHNDSLNLNDTFKVIKYEPTLFSVDTSTTYEMVKITYYESYPKRQFIDLVDPFSYQRKYNDPNDDYITPQVEFIIGYDTLHSAVYEPQVHDEVELVLNYSSNGVSYDSIYKIKSLLYENPSIYDENYLVPRKGIIEIDRTHFSNKVEWLLLSSKIYQ